MKSGFDVNNSFGITLCKSSSLGPMSSLAMDFEYAYSMEQASSIFKKAVVYPVNTLATFLPAGTSYQEGW